MKASAILTRASRKLIDETGITWPETELLDDLNAAQRDVVSLKPEAGTTSEMVQTVGGARQKLPDKAQYLVDVLANKDGHAITRVDRGMMDRFSPGWQGESADNRAQHYLFDDRDPSTFYLYPPRPIESPEEVEAVFVATPEPVADAEDPISLSDGYAEALFYGVMARALAKDTGAADYQKSLQYQQLMQGVLMGKIESKMMMHPLQLEERARK